ncbi:TolC family outer membrane protein [Thiomicrorhabdus sp.]|uniref:TolC family outer membrane protein n=1 Tax=Thiomicrorhabdus sp. TaxID=2039724 RepID=UPI0029C905E1|nr:TolC family outer membrane protein [Thiomicrorhabdus sp.]
MRRRFPKLFAALGSAFILSNLSVGTAHAIELVPTVEDAILHNPEFREQVKAHQGVQADLRGAEGGWLPKVDLGAGIGQEKITTTSANTDMTRKEAAVTVSQNLFEGFATESEITRQQARLDSAGYSAHAKANQIALDMVEAYVNLLKEQELLRLAQQSHDTHQRILDQIMQRNQAGVGNSVEVDQAKARLSLASSNLIAERNNYRDTLARFERVLGRMPDSDLVKPSLNYSFPAKLEDAVNTALIEHPAMRSANADIATVRYQYDVAESAFYPRVDVDVKQTWDENINGIDGKSENFQAMLRVSYNLFNGGKDDANLDKVAASVHQAAEVRNNTRRQIIENMHYAWNAEKYIRDQLEFMQKHTDLTLATLEGYRKQFSLGRRSLLDLLNTEDEYISAQRALVTSQHDHLISQYRILNGMGLLLNALNIKVDYALAENEYNEE